MFCSFTLRNLTSEHTMIHCNLAASLALAQIVFLLGTKATGKKVAFTFIYLCLLNFSLLNLQSTHYINYNQLNSNSFFYIDCL